MAEFIGGSGDDWFFGTAENDHVEGNGGDDTFFGGAGVDYLDGGSGTDTLDGGTGGDTYVFRAGDGVNTIIDVAGPSEENVLQLLTPGLLLDSFALTFSGGFLQLQSKTTSDLIQMSGFDPNNVYGPHAIETFVSSSGFVMSYDSLVDYLGITSTGTAGADILNGTNGFDHMTGGAGNDTLSGGVGGDDIAGGDGNDILAGGKGNDLLLGGAGNDTYRYNVGDGFDIINDTIAPGEGNVVQFGAGILLDNLVLTFNTSDQAMQIRTGNAGDVIQLSNFNPSNAYGEHTVDTFQFADGSTLTYKDMIDWGFDITGTAGADTLTGTNAGDLIKGLDGNDTLQSGAGDDALEGGAGADTLVGGTGVDWLFGGDGNDTYQFNRGDGQDIVMEGDATPGNTDRLLFGNTINPLDLVLSRQANDLRVAIHGSADQVTIANWYGGPNNMAVVEDLQAGNGQHLLNTQVDQLTQAMASFTQQTGLTWDQAIDQRPQEVQTVLAASWQ
jgi:Ca2+-binding RTX toxin-like protein